MVNRVYSRKMDVARAHFQAASTQENEIWSCGYPLLPPGYPPVTPWLPGATLSLFVKSNAAFRRRYQNRIVPPIIRAPPYASADNRL